MPKKGLLTRTYSARDQVPDCTVFPRAKNKLPFWDKYFIAVSHNVVTHNWNMGQGASLISYWVHLEVELDCFFSFGIPFLCVLCQIPQCFSNLGIVTWSTTERREIRNYYYPSVFELTGHQRLTVKREIRNVGQLRPAVEGRKECRSIPRGRSNKCRSEWKPTDVCTLWLEGRRKRLND